MSKKGWVSEGEVEVWKVEIGKEEVGKVVRGYSWIMTATRRLRSLEEQHARLLRADIRWTKSLKGGFRTLWK